MKFYSRRRCLRTLIIPLIITIVLFLLYYNTTKRIEEKSPPRIAHNTSWIKCFGSTYIYSAFWDERDIPHVKILAVGTYDELLAKARCSTKVHGAKISFAHTTFHIMDFENNGVQHTPLFFHCYPENGKRPIHVALSVPGEESSSWLPVLSMTSKSDVSNKIAACVRPLFEGYKDIGARIVEFIAFYQIIGVSHFVFYDYQISSSTKQLLQQLSFSGASLQILPWSIPPSVERSWQQGQVASITDCTYRLASAYEFVLIIDLDEYIIPRSNVTLQHVLLSVTKASHQPSASYIFRQCFFCADAADDPAGSSLPLHLLTQTKIIRKNSISPWSSRAKSIVRPKAVILPGIHKILLTYGKWPSIVVIDPEIAFVHHYRSGVCTFSERKMGYNTVKDITAFRYRNLLLNSLPIKMHAKVYGPK